MSRPRVSPLLASPVELKTRVEAERAGVPFLVCRDQRGEQKLMPLAADAATTLGRAPGCGVCLDWDEQVSGLHAELYRAGGHWVVADDGLSRNGTYVNGERVGSRRRLRDGDQIEVGRTILLFRAPKAKRTDSTVVVDRAVIAPPELTPAQRRVLVALCRPYSDEAAFATPASNQQIADELYLSVPAVKTHLRALFQRFGIGDLPQNEKRSALVKAALGRGAVSLSDIDSSR